MGGGDDGGYGERIAAEDRRKARAREAVNLNFGIGRTGPSAISPEDYMRQVWVPGGDRVGKPGVGDTGAQGYWQSMPDEEAYNAALAEEAKNAGVAAPNKTALDSLYGKVRTDAFDAGKRRIDEQRGTAARDLKFELFARGQNGGSVDIDQNALLGRKYDEGRVDLGAKADGIATGLRTNDETTRVGLLQSIDNGMDQGSAVSSALAQLKNNADRAASEATGTSLGNLFADAGLLYEQGRRSRGEQSAIDAWRRQTTGQSSRAPIGGRTNYTTWAG